MRIATRKADRDRAGHAGSDTQATMGASGSRRRDGRKPRQRRRIARRIVPAPLTRETFTASSTPFSLPQSDGKAQMPAPARVAWRAAILLRSRVARMPRTERNPATRSDYPSKASMSVSSIPRNLSRLGGSAVPGVQPTYSDLAIEVALSIRMIFRLPLRQIEGFLRSLAGLLGPGLPIPDHTTRTPGYVRAPTPRLPFW